MHHIKSLLRRGRFTINLIASTFKVVMTHQQNAEEFLSIRHGRCHSVDVYGDHLWSLYTGPETQHISRDRWRVSEIRTYKQRWTGDFDHQYLVATLHDGEGGEILLCIERRILTSSMDASNSIVRRLRTGAGFYSRTAQQGQVRVKRGIFRAKAVDQVSIYVPEIPHVRRRRRDIPVLIEHIQFNDGHHPPLPQLILLACAIHDYSDTFNLTNRDSSWFCYVTTQVLRSRFEHTSPPLQTSDHQSRPLLPVEQLFKGSKFDKLFKNYDNLCDGFAQSVC